MIFFLISLTFISCGLLFYIIICSVYHKKLNIKNRLRKISQTYQEGIQLDDRRNLPFKNRIIYPILQKFRRLVWKITPEGIRDQLEKQLVAANFPFGVGVTRLLGFKVTFYIILPFVFLLYLQTIIMTFNIKLLLLVFFAGICILLPNAMINARVKSRRKKIQHQLPDILDLLTISVEAGLSFDGALEQIVKKDKSELAHEFTKVLQEMHFGKTRREALLDMIKRCEVADLKIFISTLLQAERLGVSIAKILRIQAGQMRNKRRQRAKEQAFKAPVKMIFPLVLFIFPSILIVIIGPAIIQIKDMFL